jgi:hypothetical protein
MTVRADRAAPNDASGKRPEGARASSRRGRRVAAVLGGAVAVAVCLVLVNQLLVWRALRRLGESSLRLSYERAISWIPGVIHVRRVIVKPRGTTWSATAERVRADLAVADLLQGSLRIEALKGKVVEWKESSSGSRASGELSILARRIAGTEDAFRIEAAELTLESWQLQLGSELRAVLDGELELTTIRAPLTRGGMALKASALQLKARLSRHGVFRDVPLLVSGRLGVSDGRFDPRTRVTATIQTPVDVSLGRWMLRVSAGSVLKLTARTVEPALTGNFANLTLRSRDSNREVLLLKDARLEPLRFAMLGDASDKPLELQLRAAELGLDSGTDLGRLSSPLRLAATVARHERSAWQITSATLELPRLHFGASAPREPPLRAVIRVRDTEPSAPDGATDLQGDVALHGDRLGTLYPLLGIPPSIELMLSPFREQPFSASADLESTGADVSLSELSVRTHTLELRGFLRFAPSQKRGALLVVTPAATLGLSLGNEGQDVTMRPPPDWLDRQHLTP